MEGYPSLSAYLKTQGVTDTTPLERIAELKKNYWKAYHKRYHQKRKKTERRFTLRLTEQEYNRFSMYAQQHNHDNMGLFIKKAASAYLDKQYLPRDEAAAENLLKAIRRIGNAVNQVVQSIHRTAKRERLTGAFADEKSLVILQREYEFLVGRLDALQQEVKAFMVSPPKRVGETLWEILSKEPDKIEQVRALLDKIESKTVSHAHH